MMVNDSLRVVDLPVGGGVTMAVSSSFTRIAKSVANGERAIHVKRNGNKQPIHHYHHQHCLDESLNAYLIDSDLDTTSPEVGKVVFEVIV